MGRASPAMDSPHSADAPSSRRRYGRRLSDERAAGYAVKLITSSPEIDVRFTLRRVLGERDEVQMVVREASLIDPGQADRVETCMAGAHG